MYLFFYQSGCVWTNPDSGGAGSPSLAPMGLVGLEVAQAHQTVQGAAHQNFHCSLPNCSPSVRLSTSVSQFLWLQTISVFFSSCDSVEDAESNQIYVCFVHAKREGP